MAGDRPEDRPDQDLLEALSARARAGEQTARRLGGRRWGTLGGDRRERLFERLGIANPWDPDAPEEPPVALGPVALKLTDRRQPAPHARPPSREQSSKPSAGTFKPKGVPDARRAPQPAAARPATQKPAAARPAARPATQKPAAGPGMQKPAAPSGEGPPPAELPGGIPAPPPLPKPQKKARTGRVRLGPRTEARAPIFKEKAPPPSAPTERVEEAPAEAPPPPPRAAPPAGNMGLDDLFGFADGGSRMRLGQRSEAATGDGDEEP